MTLNKLHIAPLSCYTIYSHSCRKDWLCNFISQLIGNNSMLTEKKKGSVKNSFSRYQRNRWWWSEHDEIVVRASCQMWLINYRQYSLLTRRPFQEQTVPLGLIIVPNSVISNIGENGGLTYNPFEKRTSCRVIYHHMLTSILVIV